MQAFQFEMNAFAILSCLRRTGRKHACEVGHKGLHVHYKAPIAIVTVFSVRDLSGDRVPYRLQPSVSPGIAQPHAGNPVLRHDSKHRILMGGIQASFLLLHPA